MTTTYFLQSAYVLHYRPYRDTSLLIDFFTREYGIVSAIARGIRGGKSSQKGLLQPFIPLLISFIWKKELAVLTQTEPDQSTHQLQGKQLFSAFYLNELLSKLLQRHDAYPQLYDDYHCTLQELTRKTHLEIALRRFEKKLLSALGYGLDLTHEAQSQEAILPDLFYYFVPQKGFCHLIQSHSLSMPMFSGKSLLALANENFEDSLVLPELKQLLRMMIADLLGHKKLKSRDLFQVNNDV